MSTSELIAKKQLSNIKIKCLILKHPADVCETAKNFTYNEEVEYIINNDRRNKFIRNLSFHGRKHTYSLSPC